jgi:antitoxin component YwqK of YwqJK toxin-antitoxin module
LNFFQGQDFRLTQWRLEELDEEDILPKYAVNLQTRENVILSRKQRPFVKLFYEHFFNCKIGDEWMWFSEAYNKLEERYQNPNWQSMTDIFEKSEGNYKDWEKDGLYTEWYENGKKEGKGNTKDGELDGLWTFWYENGKKATEEEMLNFVLMRKE